MYLNVTHLILKQLQITKKKKGRIFSSFLFSLSYICITFTLPFNVSHDFTVTSRWITMPLLCEPSPLIAQPLQWSKCGSSKFELASFYYQVKVDLHRQLQT